MTRPPLADLCAELAEALLGTIRDAAFARAAVDYTLAGRPPHDHVAERDLLACLLTCDALEHGAEASAARARALRLVEDIDPRGLSRLSSALLAAIVGWLEIDRRPTIPRVARVAGQLLGAPPARIAELCAGIVELGVISAPAETAHRVRERAARLPALEALERARLELLAPDPDHRVAAAALEAAHVALQVESA